MAGKVNEAAVAVGQAVATATNFALRQVTGAARVLDRNRLGRAAVVVVLAVGAAVVLAAVRGRAIAAGAIVVENRAWDQIVHTISNVRGWTPALDRC